MPAKPSAQVPLLLHAKPSVKPGHSAITAQASVSNKKQRKTMLAHVDKRSQSNQRRKVSTISLPSLKSG